MILGRLLAINVEESILCRVELFVDGLELNDLFSLVKTFRDDWYRVLITSKGQVSTAPKVPASL